MRCFLTTNDFEVLVSDQDFDFLSQWNWHVRVENLKPRGVQRSTISRDLILLHHEILRIRGIPFNEVDHRDRNVLNNQFENLRPATRSQNCSNRGLPRNNTTGYKGVSFHKRDNRFVARIQVGKTTFALGYFTDSEEAAKAYDLAAKRLHGEFAILNFPETS